MLLTGPQRETIGTCVPLLFHPPDETTLPRCTCSRLRHDFAPQHNYDYAYVAKTLQLRVALHPCPVKSICALFTVVKWCSQDVRSTENGNHLFNGVNHSLADASVSSLAERSLADTSVSSGRRAKRAGRRTLKYASFLKIRATCNWSFLLYLLIDDFLRVRSL